MREKAYKCNIKIVFKIKALQDATKHHRSTQKKYKIKEVAMSIDII